VKRYSIDIFEIKFVFAHELFLLLADTIGADANWHYSGAQIVHSKIKKFLRKYGQ
jgi:hypothetical protein